MTWPLELLNLLFPLKFHSATFERQLSYLKCFVTMRLWQLNNLSTILCQQSIQLYYICLTCWKVLLLLENIWFFAYDFKNVEHLITLATSIAASREPLIIFIALTASPSANWRAWPQQHVEWTQSRLCTLLLQS